MHAQTPNPKFMIWPKRPPLAFCVAKMSVAEMSGPKRPRPKCPWPKCPTFEGIGARSPVVTSMKFGYAFEHRCAFIGNHAHAGSVQGTT